jgi:hypothetical protein
MLPGRPEHIRESKNLSLPWKSILRSIKQWDEHSLWREARLS